MIGGNQKLLLETTYMKPKYSQRTFHFVGPTFMERMPPKCEKRRSPGACESIVVQGGSQRLKTVDMSESVANLWRSNAVALLRKSAMLKVCVGII